MATYTLAQLLAVLTPPLDLDKTAANMDKFTNATKFGGLGS